MNYSGLTSIWGIKRSLWRSWLQFMTIEYGSFFHLYPSWCCLYEPLRLGYAWHTEMLGPNTWRFRTVTSTMWFVYETNSRRPRTSAKKNQAETPPYSETCHTQLHFHCSGINKLSPQTLFGKTPLRGFVHGSAMVKVVTILGINSSHLLIGILIMGI